MADVDDRWYRTVRRPDGTTKRERTARYGTGKRWVARWRDDHGKQRSKSFEVKADAERFLAEVTVDLSRGAYVDPAAGKITFRQYAEQWRAAAMHRDSTAEKVERELRNHVYPFIGARPIAAFRPSHIQAWVTGRAAELAPSTTAVVYGYVASIFKAAERDRIIGRSPCDDGIRLPDRAKKRADPPAPETVAALAAKLPARYQAVVWLAAGSGLRASELFGLEVECVDFLRRELHVRQQLKTGEKYTPYLGEPKTPQSYRTVPLDDDTVRGLSAHLARFDPVELEIEDRTDPRKPRRRPARLIFTTRQLTPMQRATWTQIFGPPARAVGLPPRVGLHALRHFYASMLIRFGASVKEVQARLGHSSAQTTLDVYGHLWPDDDERTRAAVAAGLADVRQMCADLEQAQ